MNTAPKLYLNAFKSATQAMAERAVRAHDGQPMSEDLLESIQRAVNAEYVPYIETVKFFSGGGLCSRYNNEIDDLLQGRVTINFLYTITKQHSMSEVSVVVKRHK